MEKQPCVYILASSSRSTLYVGVTSQHHQRVWQHKNHVNDSFTSKYKVHDLMYYEFFDNMNDAIYREKQLKGWRRIWKDELISRENPDWFDLYLTF